MQKKLKAVKSQLTMLLNNGPCRETEVRETIMLAGYSERTYHRARKSLRVQTRRYGWGDDGYWEISLPGKSNRRAPVVESAGSRQSA
jgi:hypothetical protein